MSLPVRLTKRSRPASKETKTMQLVSQPVTTMASETDNGAAAVANALSPELPAISELSLASTLRSLFAWDNLGLYVVIFLIFSLICCVALYIRSRNRNRYLEQHYLGGRSTIQPPDMNRIRYPEQHHMERHGSIQPPDNLRQQPPTAAKYRPPPPPPPPPPSPTPLPSSPLHPAPLPPSPIPLSPPSPVAEGFIAVDAEPAVPTTITPVDNPEEPTQLDDSLANLHLLADTALSQHPSLSDDATHTTTETINVRRRNTRARARKNL